MICKPHTCACENGVPMPLCNGDNVQSCRDCSYGYHLVQTKKGVPGQNLPERKCELNVCKCNNMKPGLTPPQGADCPAHNFTLCTKDMCDAGFKFLATTQQCERPKCRCPDGVPNPDPTKCDGDSQIACDKCDYGYVLKEVSDSGGKKLKKCVLKECKCENGTPARGKNCYEDGQIRLNV